MVPAELGGLDIVRGVGDGSLVPDDDLARASEAFAFLEVGLDDVDGDFTTGGGLKEKEGIEVGACPCQWDRVLHDSHWRWEDGSEGVTTWGKVRVSRNSFTVLSRA